ncbi:hypothetical protein Tco_0939992 [Tanacetum coccineum]|uniref:Uncharacterized protein n=1 Tax=Tanacetum coccineum TaxID=301880 RepID=A0ABQ5DP28_9ASTR
MEITATIDGKVKVVYEASIRIHLQLEDSDRISTLPNAEIFEQLALMHKRLLLPHKRAYIAPTLTYKLFSNMRRAKGYTRVNTPLFQTMLVQGQNVQGEGSTILVESHQTPTSAPSTSQPPTSSPSMQTTHAAPMPYDSPIPNSYHIKVIRGRSLFEDMDLDARISLVPPHVVDQGSSAKVLADAARIRRGVENVHTYTRRRTVSTGSGLVSTAGMAQEVEINIPSPVATKDKDKAVMQEYEPPKKIKKRVQIQMSIDEELAQKLHEEEQARFNAE